jgi:hypothetical protein
MASLFTYFTLYLLYFVYVYIHLYLFIYFLLSHPRIYLGDIIARSV